MLANGEPPAAEGIIGPEGLAGCAGIAIGAIGRLENGEAPGSVGIRGPLGAAGGWAAFRLRFNDGGMEPTKSA